MKNTELNSSSLSAFITSEDSLQALLGMIDDLGLEILDISVN